MALRLISEYSATTRPAFVTLGKQTKIGRNASNDVILCSTRQVAGVRGTVTPSSWISRTHAVIHEEAEGFYLQDCSSTGTYLNSVRVPKGERILLEEGMEIFFGVDSYKCRVPPKVDEEVKERSDFFFVFEKSGIERKRQAIYRTPLQMPRKRVKLGHSGIQISRNAETQTMNPSLASVDVDSSECTTQVHLYDQQTPLRILSQSTPSRGDVVELPWQQTISTLRDMLKTERDEKAASIEQIQSNSQQREAELNSRLEQLLRERKNLERELSEVRLAMAKHKAEASAEIERIREKVQKVQSELDEKERKNTEYMENLVTKLTTVHKKEIEEHAQRIRELEMSRATQTQVKRERVILQFGERPSSQTRRCQISLDWTTGRLCELVHRKYVKKVPGNQMEVVLHRTYNVLEHHNRLDSYDIRKGDRLIIRRSQQEAQPLNGPVNSMVIPARRRRPSLMTITPNSSTNVSQTHNNSLTTVVGDNSGTCSPRRSCTNVSESCDLSPFFGESKIRSYREKMRNRPQSAKQLSYRDDEKNSCLEPPVNGTAVKREKNNKSIEELSEMEKELEEYYSGMTQNPKPSPKQGARKHVQKKSLVNPKLKPKR